MGLFSKIANNARSFQKIANSVSNVKSILDDLEYEPDSTGYLIAAWICRVGIMDIMESSYLQPTNILFVNINGHNTKMTIMEAYMMSVGRLSTKAGTLDSELKDAILDVLDKGRWFYEIDKTIPADKRAIFQ